MTQAFPQLGPADPTRDALQAYAQVLGAVRQKLTPPHPRWWHVSLRVAPEGFSTGVISDVTDVADVADTGDGSESAGAPLVLTLDVARHELQASLGDEVMAPLDLTEGRSGAAVGESVRDWLAGYGVTLPGDFNPKATEADHSYSPESAIHYHSAFAAVRSVFEAARSRLTGEIGPVQLWPHHFDLSFEWFGSRWIQYEEHGEQVEAPAQIGFGFSTGDDGHPEPYFYANPWPFEDAFSKAELPGEARWHTESWRGGLLPYSAVASSSDGDSRLADFLAAVHAAAAPALTE